MTAVITAFMIGLGSGGLLGSWLSSRASSNPLLIFATMEATIAIFGLASLRIFAWVGAHVGGSSLTIRTLVSIAVLLIPTCCMGATLPLLVGHAVKRSINVGASTGRLYYVNTLGAVLGCIFAGICIFPFLGIAAALRVAAIFNIIACFGAGIAYLRTTASGRRAPPTHIAGNFQPPHPRKMQAVAFPAALFLSGFSGFVSLSYEIFFFHLTGFASGGNSVTFVLMLAAVLLGIAVGAREVGEKVESIDGVPSGFFDAMIWASATGMVILPLMAHSNVLKWSMVIALLPAAIFIAKALGTVFPLVAHLAVLPDEKAGFRVGLIYTMNIVGSALGTVLTGLVLSQMFGLRGLAILLAVLSLCLTGLFAAAIGPERRRRPTALQLFGLILAAALFALHGTLTTNLFETMLAKVNAKYIGAARDVVETRSGIIVVNQYGTVFGGGVYDGAFNVNPYEDVNGIIRPYSLSLFHPSPRNVLMIGLSSGSWAQVIANNPYVSHLTVIEIDPGYLSLIRGAAIVRTLLTNRKLNIILDDGHRWLEAHPEMTFDAIVVNATFHFRANSSNLLSVEFDQMVREHLNPGGVYLFNATDSIRAQRTGCLSFKYGFRILNNVIVSDSPFDLDVARWGRVLLNYSIDGRQMFPTGNPSQVGAFNYIVKMPSEIDDKAIAPADRRIERCDSLMQRTAAMPLITNDNMGTEWRYPLLHRE